LKLQIKEEKIKKYQKIIEENAKERAKKVNAKIEKVLKEGGEKESQAIDHDPKIRRKR